MTHQDDDYDPLDDLRKSYDVCITALRAELVAARCKNPNVPASSILSKKTRKSGSASEAMKPDSSGGRSR